MANNVTNMRLCLHTRPLTEAEVAISYEDSQLGPLLGLADGYCFKHLRKLILESIAFFQQEFFDFLEANKTLDSLGLRNIVLLRESSDRPRGCFVEVLRHLREHRLRDIGFGGYLSNGGNQLWYPTQKAYTFQSSKERNKSLHWKIRCYVLQHSPSLPPELIRNQVVHSHNDVLPPSTAIPWIKGDCTWSMTLRTTPPADQAFFEDQDDEVLMPLPPTVSLGHQDEAAAFTWIHQPPTNSHSIPLHLPFNVQPLVNSHHPSQTGNDEVTQVVGSEVAGVEMGGGPHPNYDQTANKTPCTPPGPASSWPKPIGAPVYVSSAQEDPLADFDFDEFLDKTPQDPFSEVTVAEETGSVDDQYTANAAIDDMDEDWEDEVDDAENDKDVLEVEDASSSSSDMDELEYHPQQNGDQAMHLDEQPNGNSSAAPSKHLLIQKDATSPMEDLLSQKASKVSPSAVNGDDMEE